MVSETINSLSVLYNKIKNGKASEEEIILYNTKIKISCMNEELLIKAIEQRAKEIEKD